MATHEVNVEFTIQMHEMDGEPVESAEVFLNAYVDEVRKAIEDVVGSPIVHLEVTEAWEAEDG